MWQEGRRLRDEVERQPEEQAAPEQARLTPPARRPSAEEEAPSAILVFRDGRRSEVQNFAIVGQTIWVFPAQRARKVPVSDLDVEATRKANADRSVEFRFP